MFKELLDRVFGAKTQVEQEAETDDLRYDRKRLDKGLAKLVGASENVVKTANEFDLVVRALVEDMRNKEKPHGKTPARHKKT